MPNIAIDPSLPAFPQLVEQAAFFAHEGMELFDEHHGESAETRVDLGAAPPSLTIVGPDLTYGVQFLGSFSEADHTFLWGWENVNGFPDQVLEVAESAHTMGEHMDIDELTTAKLQLADESDVLPLLFAVIRSTGNPCVRTVPTGQGFAYFLATGFELPPARVLQVQRAIAEGLASGRVQDHIAALQGYLDLRPGITVRETDTELVIECSDGSLTITLDDHGRIVAMRCQTGRQSNEGPLGRLLGALSPRRWRSRAERQR